MALYQLVHHMIALGTRQSDFQLLYCCIYSLISGWWSWHPCFCAVGTNSSQPFLAEPRYGISTLIICFDAGTNAGQTSEDPEVVLENVKLDINSSSMLHVERPSYLHRLHQSWVFCQTSCRIFGHGGNTGLFPLLEAGPFWRTRALWTNSSGKWWEVAYTTRSLWYMCWY